LSLLKKHLFIITFLIFLLFGPIKVLAAQNCYILTDYDSRHIKESNAMQKEIMVYFKKNGDQNSTCQVIKIPDEQSFVDTWNSICDAYLIIFNCHGDFLTAGSIDVDGLYKLKKINCSCLWLLGCNNAHSRFESNNIAGGFAKKISGIVVASDGTVKSVYGGWTMFGTKQEFISEGDSIWQKYNGTNGGKPKGWVCYLAISDFSQPQIYDCFYDIWLIGLRIEVTVINCNTLSVKEVLNLLDDYY